MNNNNETSTDISTAVVNEVEEVDSHTSSVIPSVIEAASTEIIDFLGRPLQIAAIPYSDLASVQTLDPMKVLLNSPPIKRKRWNYNLFSATLVVEVRTLAVVYAYGQIITSVFYPIDSLFTTSSTYFPFQASTRQHVLSNIAKSGSSRLEIPWTNPYPYFDLFEWSEDAINDYPRINISVLAPLARADTGGVPSGQITIFAWFKDIKLTTPIPNVYASKESASSNKQGFISGPLATISKAALVMKDFSLGGALFSAASTVFKGASDVAKFFGFSKPLDLSFITTVGPTPNGYYEGLVQLKRLTVDPGQAVALDAADLGMGEDPLTFKRTIGRSSLLSISTYSSSQVVGDLVFELPVAPCYTYTSSANTEFVPTCLCYYSLPFRYWRGSIKYHIEVVASPFHRGRLRFFFTPHQTTTDVVEVTAASHAIDIDISECTVLNITVPWHSAIPYRPVELLPIGSEGVDNPGMNGLLTCQVIDSLYSPSSASPVYVMVWVAAGDDFDLVVPSTQVINNFSPLAYHDATNATPHPTPLCFQFPTTSQPTLGNITNFGNNAYNSYPWTFASMEQQIMPSITSGIAERDVVFGTVGPNVLNKKYIGESFPSLRPYCKRAVTSYIPLTRGNENGSGHLFYIPYHPPVPGTYTAGSDESPLYYHPRLSWTSIGWFSLPYRGFRGSVRINVLPTVNGHTTSPDGYASANEAVDYLFAQIGIDTSVDAGLDSVLAMYKYNDNIEYFDTGVGQEISFDIPYRAQTMLDQWNLTSKFTVGDTYPQRGAYVAIAGGSAPTHEVRYSAGEDWTVGPFNQIPALYTSYTVQDSAP